MVPGGYSPSVGPQICSLVVRGREAHQVPVPLPLHPAMTLPGAGGLRSPKPV